ncbi:hypothetical protein ACFOLJ_23480 [Rugamonas sp. CCM 8940]|uniref:transposase n=1 Tax=Rugamonas sp. CCM 8940 TaxID=2765359 RepID=UPI001F40B7FA
MFGTFKMHLRGHMIRDELHLARSLPSFQFWYNVVRSHQHLGGRTPHQVWCGVDPFKAGPRSVRAFCAWDGRLKAVVLRH